MGTAERKAKEKEELRSLILEGARKLFVQKGIEQTTIRNIADAIDYSVGTVYVYFKDKNAILHALHSQGFQELGQQFAVLTSVADPMERLRAMGRIYIRFALENRDMYELMFVTKAPMNYLHSVEEEEWTEGTTAFNALRMTVRDCIGAGHFAGHQLEPLTFLIWSAVHGMCSLEISERIKGVVKEEAPSAVALAFDEFWMMLARL
ncbi:TetR/AcrR family transcriptional regulator [Tellurirhabdus rosea]|uniref:TetR/AcrR family transcriptional regulator n=1 Tax=Tellurirhabdus rosea TaxID=2674997 RepID=UPI00224E801F|nr:TetR/AcrR family transcriptional regulator [Tellurirhabdus rosea]